MTIRIGLNIQSSLCWQWKIQEGIPNKLSHLCSINKRKGKKKREIHFKKGLLFFLRCVCFLESQCTACPLCTATALSPEGKSGAWKWPFFVTFHVKQSMSKKNERYHKVLIVWWEGCGRIQLLFMFLNKHEVCSNNIIRANLFEELPSVSILL